MVQKNERIKSVGKGTCLKGKAEISGGALKLQKSQECCRRREESGRILLEGQRTRRKGRKVLQKRLGNEGGGGGMARRIPKEAQGI